METPNVTAVLNQLLVRYRRGAALHVGLSTGLGLGCVGLVVWRLVLHGASRSILWGIGATGVMSVVVWQWRFLRRERLNRRQLVAQLDESLGLKARLLTAVEFADAPEPPALYPRLLEETTKTLPAAFRRLPPVVDRRMAALAAAVVLLWWWPRSPVRLTQLAMHPTSVMPPPEPPPPQPNQPPPSPEQRQDRSGRESSPSSSGQRGQTGQQDSTRNSSQSSAQSSGSQDSHGSQASQTSPSQSDRGSQPDARQAQQQSSPQAKASSGSQDQGRQGTPQKQQQASASGSQQQQTSGSQQREQSGRSGQTSQAQAKAAAAQDRDAAARESGAKQQLAKLSQAAGAQQQAGSSAQQELLKGDIQQLLKELSTELKQMQTELEAAQRNGQANPMPGTSTDPNLYGDSAQAKQAAGNRLPVQLEVDTQPTASTRRGGGVGKPSTEVADTLPQQQPEEASLSDVRTTETGVAPQAIPPEYRPVFERLSRQ